MRVPTNVTKDRLLNLNDVKSIANAAPSQATAEAIPPAAAVVLSKGSSVAAKKLKASAQLNMPHSIEGEANPGGNTSALDFVASTESQNMPSATSGRRINFGV